MRNPFKPDAEMPIAYSVGEDDMEDKADYTRQLQYPEGYYEYKAELIIPAATDLWHDITKDAQLGNLTRQEYENAQAIYGAAMVALKFRKTRKYGVHVLKLLYHYYVSSNSKDGFLRKQEQTRTKEAIIKQQKNWKERVKW